LGGKKLEFGLHDAGPQAKERIEYSSWLLKGNVQCFSLGMTVSDSVGF